MISDLPVESVNGQQEWEWNEQRSSRSVPADSSTASGGRPHGSREGRRRVQIGSAADRTTDPPRRDAALEREVDRLEAELERKEDHLQHVIEQYERLLAKKNRELAQRNASSDDETHSPIRTVVELCVPDR